MDKIDPRLIINFQEEKKLDLLIRTNNENWEPIDIPDYEEIFRLGKTLGCIGTIETIKVLQKDPNVLFVEGDQSGFTE